MFRVSSYQTRLLVLVTIIVALTISLVQAVKSPEPRNSSKPPRSAIEQTPSAVSDMKRRTPQTTSPLPTTNRCATPISLRVGQIDEQFNIDATVLTTALVSAAHEWNTATGRTLFVIRDDGDIAVNLLFDGRQDLINQRAGKERAILALLEDLAARLRALTSEIERHKSAVAEWNRETQEHNKLIEMINTQSDLLEETSKDYAALQAERQRIDEMGIHLKEAKSLLVHQRELLDKQSYELMSEKESLQARILSFKEQFSSNLLTAGEHRLGLLVNEINMYVLYNLETFHAVLLHEMGHALGLPHTEKQPAIMHPVIGHSSDLSNLTPLDIQAALALCGS